METKNNPGERSCYVNALPDEPMFVLLARDPDFSRLIMEWSSRRIRDVVCGDRPESDMELVNDAYNTAAAGAKWRRNNMGKWRKPPETP